MRKIVVFLVIVAMLLFAVVPAMAADLPGDEPAAAVPEAPVPDDAEAEAPADSQLTEVPEETAPPADETLGDIQEVAAEEATADLMAFTAEIKGAEQPIVAPAPASLDLYVNGAPATEGSGYTFEWMTTDINGNWVALDSGDMKGPEVGAKVVFDSTYPLLDGMKVKCVVTNAASEIVETQPVELSVKREHTILTVNNQPVMPGGATADGSISLSADGKLVTLNGAKVTMDNTRWNDSAIYIEAVDTDLTVKINGVNEAICDYTDPADEEPDMRMGSGITIMAEGGRTLNITTDDDGEIFAKGGYLGISIGVYGKEAKTIIDNGVFINTESTNAAILPISGAAFSAYTDVDLVMGIISGKSVDANCISIEGKSTGLTIGDYGAVFAENNSPQVGVAGSGSSSAIEVSPNLTITGGYISARIPKTPSLLSTGLSVSGSLKMYDGAEIGTYVNSTNGSVIGLTAKYIMNDSGTIRSTAKTTHGGALAIRSMTNLDSIDLSYTYGNASGTIDTNGIYVGSGKTTDTLKIDLSTVRGISNSTAKRGTNAGIVAGKISVNTGRGGIRYGKLIGESKNGPGVLALLNADTPTKKGYTSNYKPQSLKLLSGTMIITPKKVGEISPYSVYLSKGHYAVYETVYGVGKNAVLENRVVLG